ncbi:hypothetical protein [Ligilactobacillus agilis]|uniref:hypothetical protein n=1 Tax=Ligilactobacillus agilis TaxID=1601 RepID=UPI0022E57E3F|nr:hypothetical protein [Ligilactobacillus agilis]
MKNEIIEKIQRFQNVQKDCEERIKLVSKNIAQIAEQIANGNLTALDDLESEYEWLQNEINELNRYKAMEAVCKDLLKSEDD